MVRIAPRKNNNFSHPDHPDIVPGGHFYTIQVSNFVDHRKRNKMSAKKDTATVVSHYLTEYGRIVRPHQRFTIPKYFIDHWLSRLGPTFAWLVISFQQAYWLGDSGARPISLETLAKQLGLTYSILDRELRENPFRHWFIQAFDSQGQAVDLSSKPSDPLPPQYQVYTNPPLIPEHLAGLYAYLRDVDQIDEVEAALDRLLELNTGEMKVLLEEQASGADRQFDRPLSPAAVVQLATGIDLTGSSAQSAAGLMRRLIRFEGDLTTLGYTVCRQYFRKNWVPVLGPAMAWLIMVLRSRCYDDHDTGERHDIHTWEEADLASLLGQSRARLRQLLAHEFAAEFFQILDQQNQRLTIRTETLREPIL